MPRFTGRAYGLSLRMLQSQRRSSRSGRTDLRGPRDLQMKAMAGWAGARAEKQNVLATPGTAGVHAQIGWDESVFRRAHHLRSEGRNAGRFGFRTDLRSLSAAGAFTPIGETVTHWTRSDTFLSPRRTKEVQSSGLNVSANPCRHFTGVIFGREVPGF